MKTALHDAIVAIHDAPQRCVLELAGAGSRALAWLHEIPGSSRTVLEAVDRYAPGSMAQLLGFAPARFADPRVAQLMAHRAYLRARALSQGKVPVVGLGCTATIATDRAKRGDHRAYVAVKTADETVTQALTMAKGARSRQQEEHQVSLLIVKALAQACQVKETLKLSVRADEKLETQTGTKALLPWLSRQPVKWMAVDPQGTITAGQRRPGIALLSGSFNPLHEGHQRLAHVAGEILKKPVHFELTLDNADKPSISLKEAQHRLAQFVGTATVILTWSPLFSQKAALFPGSAFVIGADTAKRLVQPRFYKNSLKNMRASLATLRAWGCRFLVAGRKCGGRFLTLKDIPIPVEHRCLFEEIPPSVFRMDVSSTALRARLGRRSSIRQ